MDSEGSLTHSRKPATCPYPQPIDPIHASSHLCKIHFNIILVSVFDCSKWLLIFIINPKCNTNIGEICPYRAIYPWAMSSNPVFFNIYLDIKPISHYDRIPTLNESI